MITRGDRDTGGEGLFDASSISVAAHELKSPLALIRQLSLELQDGSTADRNILVEQIRLISERSLRLTTNLTKVNRLQTSLFENTSINPRAVVAEVQMELAPLYRARERSLHFSSSSSLPLVSTNRDLLHRILANFADNALHYADEEGIVELFAQLRRKDDVVRLGVRDYGPRISRLQWRSIQQSHEAHVAIRPDSSGLGLAISSQFADAIGARVGAIRHKDGASFYVDVPVSKQLSLL
jgi:K+-sensing histidine kinase KdpD